MKFYNSYKVHELFASDFKEMVFGNVRSGACRSYELNLQGNDFCKHLPCVNAPGDTLLFFIDALEMELKENGIAIVFAEDYGPDYKIHTIYVVAAE